MSLAARSTVAVLILVLAGALAPVARADGADAVIADLEAQGYIVRINWVSGFDTQQLADCTVVNVNNPNSSDEAAVGDSVYVDVTCPNHLYSNGGSSGAPGGQSGLLASGAGDVADQRRCLRFEPEFTLASSTDRSGRVSSATLTWNKVQKL